MFSCLGLRGQRSPHQIILLGLPASGKTTLLYRLKLPTWKEIGKDMKTLNERKEKADPGYHYEEMTHTNPLGTYGVWDVPGSDVMISMWSTFYRYVQVAAVMFLVDGSPESASDEKAHDDKLLKARRLIHFLLNEDELRAATFFVIINDGSRDKENKNKVSGEEEKQARKQRLEHIEELLQITAIRGQDANKSRFHVHTLNCVGVAPTSPEWQKILRQIYDYQISSM